MVKYYKKRNSKISKKNLLRVVSLSVILSGISIALFVFFPLISWQVYFAPAFANAEINAPIPKSTIVSGATINSLISEASQSLSGVNYNNAQNWFPNYRFQPVKKVKITEYFLSIPKINVDNAIVTTVDNDLASHLVNY